MSAIVEKDTKKALMSIVFIGLILGLTILAFQYRKELNLSDISTIAKKGFISSHQISVHLVVIAGIEDKSLRIRLNIPCKDLKQKLKILESLPKIQHAMLISMENTNVREWVKHRNFKAIKKHAVKVVNNYSAVKVDKIYMENFFYN